MSALTRVNLARCAGLPSGISGAVGRVVKELAPTAATLGTALYALEPAVAQYGPAGSQVAFQRLAGSARELLDGRTTPFAVAAVTVRELGNHLATYPDAAMRAILGALPLAVEDADPLRELLMSHVDAHAMGALELLNMLIAIPSVSDATSLPNARTGESAQAVKAMMEGAGFDNVHFIATENANPTVYGEIITDPDLPTVMFYAHHDVQPAKPAEWDTDPWEGHLRDGRLYGRGAADDKAGFMAALAAIRAYKAAGLPLPVNVVFLIEGEEEIASPNLPALLKLLPEYCKPDVVILTDLDNPTVDTPMISLTTRGAAFFEVEIGTMADSGNTPLSALADLVATFTYPDRTLALPGFTDTPLSIPTMVRESMGSISPDTMDTIHREAGGMFEGEAMVGDASAVRGPRLRSPFTSLLITEIRGPQTMELSTGIIVPWAEARCTVQIPSGKNPQREWRRLQRMAQRLAFPGVQLSFPDNAVVIDANGTVSFTMRLETATHATHCGGNSYVRTAISELMWITAQLAGRVDTPQAPSVSSAEAQASPRERLLFGFNQVDVLAVGENRARIAFRVPPGFSAAEAYAAFQSRAHAKASEMGVTLTFRGGSIEPWAGDIEGNNPITRLFGQALDAGYGRPHIVGGSGGSIGFFDPFAERFPDALMLGAGIEDPHTHAHGPNESLDIETFQKATRSLAVFLALVRKRFDRTHRSTPT